MSATPRPMAPSLVGMIKGFEIGEGQSDVVMRDEESTEILENWTTYNMYRNLD